MSRTRVATRDPTGTGSGQTARRTLRHVDEANGPTNTFRLVTYNVDGLRDDSSEIISGSHRSCIAAILAALSAADPDVVCLQEVTPQSIALFNLKLCNSKFYPPSLVPLSSPYYTVTYVSKRHQILRMSRTEYRSSNAKSRMGRDILLVSIACVGQTVNILNTHMESGPEAAAVRAAQMCEVLFLAAGLEGVSIVCGDMNLRAAEWKEAALRAPDAVDLYDTVGAKGKTNIPNFTWQRRIPGKSIPLSSRFDRVLLQAGQSVYVSGCSYAVIGTEIVSAAEEAGWGYSTASDHLGILATLYLLRDQIGAVMEVRASNPRQMAGLAALARATVNISKTGEDKSSKRVICDLTGADGTTDEVECSEGMEGVRDSHDELIAAIDTSVAVINYSRKKRPFSEIKVD